MLNFPKYIENKKYTHDFDYVYACKYLEKHIQQKYGFSKENVKKDDNVVKLFDKLITVTKFYSPGLETRFNLVP